MDVPSFMLGLALGALGAICVLTTVRILIRRGERAAQIYVTPNPTGKAVKNPYDSVPKYDKDGHPLNEAARRR